MKRLLAPMLALLLGCASVQPPDLRPSTPLHISGDMDPDDADRVPAIDIPRGWLVSTDSRQLFKGMTTVLIAQAPRPTQGRRVSLSVSGRPWDQGSIMFAAAMVEGLERRGMEFEKKDAVYIDGVPASRTVATVDGDLVTQVNIAVDGTAYIVICTGADGTHARTTCQRLLDSVGLERTQSGPETD